MDELQDMLVQTETALFGEMETVWKDIQDVASKQEELKNTIRRGEKRMEDNIEAIRQESSGTDEWMMGGMSIIRAENAKREERAKQDMEYIKLLLKTALMPSQQRPQTPKYQSPPGSSIEGMLSTDHRTDGGSEREEGRGRRPSQEEYVRNFPSLQGSRPTTASRDVQACPRKQAGRSWHDIPDAKR